MATEAAPPDDLAATIARCPTGAFSFVRRSQVVSAASTGETMSATPNAATIKANGPSHRCSGEFAVRTADARTGTTVVLCRCGPSQTKPFCDSSHKNVRFKG